MRLLGAAEAVWGGNGWLLTQTDAAEPRYLRLAARAQLDDPALAAAWAEGQAMSLDAAIRYALALGDATAV